MHAGLEQLLAGAHSLRLIFSGQARDLTPFTVICKRCCLWGLIDGGTDVYITFYWLKWWSHDWQWLYTHSYPCLYTSHTTGNDCVPTFIHVHTQVRQLAVTLIPLLSMSVHKSYNWQWLYFHSYPMIVLPLLSTSVVRTQVIGGINKGMHPKSLSCFRKSPGLYLGSLGLLTREMHGVKRHLFVCHCLAAHLLTCSLKPSFQHYVM